MNPRFKEYDIICKPDGFCPMVIEAVNKDRNGNVYYTGTHLLIGTEVHLPDSCCRLMYDCELEMLEECRDSIKFNENSSRNYVWK